MRKFLQKIMLVVAVFIGGQAHAGIPVIDAANLANSLQELLAWGQQYEQMAQQYQQMVQQYNQAVTTYNSLSGIRGMADLVNNPSIRRYLPDEWSQAMNLLNSPGGYTNLQSSINAIKGASQVMAVADARFDPDSPAGKAFAGQQNQVATNRALSEEGFKQASDRIAAIQTLIDKVNGVPDQKDVQDLQARIQAEQAMVQNETVKLTLLSQLQQAQRDIADQQAREIGMRASARSTRAVARF